MTRSLSPFSIGGLLISFLIRRWKIREESPERANRGKKSKSPRTGVLYAVEFA